MEPRVIPFDTGGWDWGTVEHGRTRYHGRDCVVAGGASVVLADVELEDGEVALELAVGPERAFHGVVWRARDAETYESFFVRPHQAGNPDAVQYTPVFHGVSGWQLYHGEGFWAPVTFPQEAWFEIRVAFAGERAEVYVGDTEHPSLISPLKAPVGPGRVGVLVGGPDVRLARFTVGGAPRLAAPPPPALPTPSGVLRDWQVSDAFPEADLERARSEPRTWTRIQSETSGLLNLARVQGIREGRNCVLARTVLAAPRARTAVVEFGFSDRAVVYLNGTAAYRGDDGYRSRDYRFLGSIGWYDALHLPLRDGDNELVVAVSEDFGGWGVQARVID